MTLKGSLTSIWQKEGLQGLLKGNVASVARIFPFSALEFYLYEKFKNIFIRGNKDRQNKFKYNFICAGGAGWGATAATFPLEVVRTRMAASTKGNTSMSEHSIRASLIKLFKQDGIRGLFKGFWFGTTVLIYLFKN